MVPEKDIVKSFSAKVKSEVTGSGRENTRMGKEAQVLCQG